VRLVAAEGLFVGHGTGAAGGSVARPGSRAQPAHYAAAQRPARQTIATQPVLGERLGCGADGRGSAGTAHRQRLAGAGLRGAVPAYLRLLPAGAAAYAVAVVTAAAQCTHARVLDMAPGLAQHSPQP